MSDDISQLLAHLPQEMRALNGIPEDEGATDMQRAVDVAARVLSGYLQPDGLRFSLLGPSWSHDIDAHVERIPPAEMLAGAGWIRIEGLLAHLGWGEEQTWAVCDGDRVLARLELTTARRPGTLEGILSRCRRRGEVRAREVFELRALQDQGHVLPAGDPVIAAAARAEAALGGRSLAPWLDADPEVPPVALGGRSLRARLAPLKRRFGPRFVIALSGVDGAGKSTLARNLSSAFTALGLPSSVIWTRPGMRLKLLDKMGGVARKLLGQGSEPGLHDVAEGRAEKLASRKGALGWVWTTLVTISFLFDVRRRHARSTGIVIYDRHLLDALATLRFAYEGVNVAIPARLIRWFMPRADLTFYLQVSAEVAGDRKPGDLFGELAIAGQLDLYKQLLGGTDVTAVLDATAPLDENARIVLKAAGA